jgi:hypothetical protein
MLGGGFASRAGGGRNTTHKNSFLLAGANSLSKENPANMTYDDAYASRNTVKISPNKTDDRYGTSRRMNTSTTPGGTTLRQHSKKSRA